MTYYAYKKNKAPADVVAKWPQAAEYNNGNMIIVGESSSSVEHDEDVELDNEQMEARFNAVVGPRGLRLTKGQGRHIYERHVASLNSEEV